YDGVNLLGAGTLTTDGHGVTTASYSTSTLSTASHSIKATYASDANFNGSTSSALSQVVNKADTTTTLASSVNPSKFGQSVMFTATVSVPSPGSTAVASPTGTVNFSDGATLIGSGTLSTGVSGTTASFSTYSLAVGSHSITATYADDANFNPSTSSVLSQVVEKANTTTVAASSANPSVSGQTVTFTATVAVNAPGSAAVAFPSGTITFFDGVNSIGTGTLATSAGVTTATLTINTLNRASHSITATYGGDGNFNGSTSSILTQTVIKAGTSTALASSANP